MLYTLIPTILISLRKKIVEVHYSKEHVTYRATSSLLNHYFDKFTITPEQTQDISKKRPDYVVELLENNNLSYHLFVEVKSTVGKTFDQALDQVYGTILETVVFNEGSFSVFVIIMKETKIAFFSVLFICRLIRRIWYTKL